MIQRFKVLIKAIFTVLATLTGAELCAGNSTLIAFTVLL
jgi:hypothetical protein